jgi:hypothetical protein
MSRKVFAVNQLTGGVAGSLDDIRHDSIQNGDLAIAVNASSGYLYWYTYNATSTSAESSPYVIRPDSNTGAGRWTIHQGYKDYLEHMAAINAQVSAAQTYANQANLAWQSAIVSAAIFRSSTAPSTPYEGMLWWQIGTTDDILRVYRVSGTAWSEILRKNRTTGAISMLGAAGTVMPGTVNADGTGSLPTGWTVTRPYTGLYQVTHNLNRAATTYVCHVTVDGNQPYSTPVMKFANYVTVSILTPSYAYANAAFDISIQVLA